MGHPEKRSSFRSAKLFHDHMVASVWLCEHLLLHCLFHGDIPNMTLGVVIRGQTRTEGAVCRYSHLEHKIYKLIYGSEYRIRFLSLQLHFTVLILICLGAETNISPALQPP